MAPEERFMMKNSEELLTRSSHERNGCKLNYWLGGAEGAPWLVLTHGDWVDHREFDLQIPAFVSNYRLLLWDVRGHGLSRPADPPFSIREAMEDLVAILDLLDIEQAAFLGHSMGGNLSQELVFYHPDRIRALVCADCTCNTLKLSKLEEWSVRMAGPLLKLYPYDVLRRQAANISALKPEVRKTLYEMFGGFSKQEYIQILLATTLCLHYEPGYRIEKPLLLIVGDQDRTGNIRKIAPIWAAREPQCELAVIPNAGHAVNLDQVDAFNQTVLAFLRKIE